MKITESQLRRIVREEVKLMSEAKRTKIKVGKRDINFLASFRNGTLDLLPATSQDYQTIEDLKGELPGGGSDIKRALEKEISKKTRLTFSYDYGYQGGGYTFKLDGKEIEKMI